MFITLTAMQELRIAHTVEGICPLSNTLIFLCQLGCLAPHSRSCGRRRPLVSL